MKISAWKLLFLILIGYMPLTAQSVFDVEQISLDQGLSQSTINAIEQDHKGFLWLGTQDGLNRFDGQEFKIFKKDPFDSTSLSENFISALLVDADGRLWIGTYHGGLNLYDPEKDIFYRFHHDPEDTLSISDNNITCLTMDGDGRIWIGTGNGFNLLIPDSGEHPGKITFNRYRYHPQGARSEKRDHIVLSLLADSSGNLWAGTYQGLYQYDMSGTMEEPVRSYRSSSVEPSSLTSDFIRGILEDKTGGVWVATNKGLNRLSLSGQGFEHYLIDRVGQDRQSQGAFIEAMTLNHEGDLLVATDRGIFQLPFVGTEYKVPFVPVDISAKYMGQKWPYSGISLLFRDRLHEGLIWAGTGLSGLGKMVLRSSWFDSYDLQTSENGSNSVRYITEDQYGNLWIGVYGGLVWANSKTGDFRSISNLDVGEYLINTRAFYKMYCDSENGLWATTYEGPVRISYDENGPISGQAFFGQVTCEDRGTFDIYEEGDKLYFTTFSGVNVLDRNTGQLYPCPIVLDSAGSRQFNYRIHKILRDSRGRLWLGSTAGLLLVQGAAGPLEAQLDEPPTIYRYDPQTPDGLMSNYINDVYEDSHGQLWVGTMEGLEKVVEDDGQISFRHFTESEGLSNHVVYGILEDPETGGLWLSTNNGINRFDPKTGDCTSFHKEDGLQTNEFNANAFFRSEDGRMYFGGVDGLSGFYPARIEDRAARTPVWITRLVTNDFKEYNLLGFSGEKRVELPFRRNSFSVQFVGLDYLSPGDEEYVYDLLGGQEKNVPVGNSNRLNFSKLPPGEYTLRVRRADNGVTSGPGVDEVKISVLAPFWMKTWFYLLIMAFLLGITWLFYYALYRFKMKRIKAIERFRKQAAQDFHDELGSKLTVISMYSELTKNQLNGSGEKVEGYLNKVIHTSGTLYESMKDLIWSLNPERDSVRDLYLQLKDFGDDLFSHGEIEFKAAGFQSPNVDQPLPMEVKRHMLLIFKELMNNVIKHAGASKVTLEMDFSAAGLTVCLADDGKGFDLDQALEAGGFGLKSIRNRAEQIGATLDIKCLEPGTRVCLSCPITRRFSLLNN